MKSRFLIEQRIQAETDPTVIDTLDWVLSSPECPLCNHPQKHDLEVKLFKQEMTPSFLEQKSGWATGCVDEHMTHHIEVDPQKEQYIEKMREDSINTLNVAENLFMRLSGYLDEWEDQRGGMPIDEEWINVATRIASECNRSVKLVGQLKKEIGVDSQLLLAERRMNLVMTAIVDVLRDQPSLLNQIEFRVAALKAPTVEADFEVME